MIACKVLILMGFVQTQRMCCIFQAFTPYFPTLKMTILGAFYKIDIISELKIYKGGRHTSKTILIKTRFLDQLNSCQSIHRSSRSKPDPESQSTEAIQLAESVCHCS